MTDFDGFGNEETNWSKLPHKFIDILPQISTKAELALLLYILRHTWGFQEFDQPKVITLDEFESGRKDRRGNRIDNGVGMARSSIIAGLKAAVKHGYLIEEVDDSDKGRILKSYMLVRDVEDQKLGYENTTPGVAKHYPRGEETLPRTEKETIERNQEKDIKPAPKPSQNGNGKAPDLLFEATYQYLTGNPYISGETKIGKNQRGFINKIKGALGELDPPPTLQELLGFKNHYTRPDERGRRLTFVQSSDTIGTYFMQYRLARDQARADGSPWPYEKPDYTPDYTPSEEGYGSWNPPKKN